MRTGRYTISELFANRHVEQLVIPEIQRDYVWGTEHVQRLMKSITDNFTNWQRDIASPPLQLGIKEGVSITADRESLEKDFTAFYSRRTHATNVGFVYAYCDADLPGQHFLIDGQQRLTTIYLALLAVGASHPDLKSRFRARYVLRPRGEYTPAPTRLDYRLREHTENFLHRMVAFLLEHPGASENLENQAWFLAEATRDTTTLNLVKNYQEIWKLLKPHLQNYQAVDLYEYIEDLVDCWYFDTNESAQGEELYLYLNARGEAIAANENQKAVLLGMIDSQERNEWGQKWEEWQDLFWTHRKKGLPRGKENPNADRGFNSFLACIECLSERQDHGSLTGLKGLQSIEQHVAITRWLEDRKDVFKSLFSYADWVDRWFHGLWAAFNDENATGWRPPPGSDGKEQDQNRQTLVWGTFLCAFAALEEAGWIQAQANPAGLEMAMGQVDLTKLFRAIRVFYLRSHNGARSPKTLPKLATIVFTENINEKGDGLKEARKKWQYLKTFDKEERREVESVIWKIEDHPLNLEGDRLGGLNLTHLVDLDPPSPDLDKLMRIRDAFYGLFPLNETHADRRQKKKLALVLLCYGPFWHQDSPWNYGNFNLGDWKRTIRGEGKTKKSDVNSSVFRCFLNDFVDANETHQKVLERQDIDEKLQMFLERKQSEMDKLEKIDPDTETSFYRAVLWYSLQLKEVLFTYGMHITEGKTGDESADVWFKNLMGLWNTSGGFQGYHNSSLARLLK